MTELLLRILSLSLALASAETLHGVFRAAVLVPRIGKKRALRVSIVTGSLLAFGLCWWLVPDMRLPGALAQWALGLWLALFMAGFDMAIGRFVMKLAWHKILRDFDPRSGNLLLFGLIGLAVWPWLVMQLH